jgi:hypothetical protein
LINIVIKFLNLNEILPAVTLGLNVSCAWFLARSFLSIGLPILRELGVGALCEKPLTLFGVRWKIVETAIKQKAEVVYGLSLLVLAALCGFVTLFMSLKPHNWISTVLIVTITIILFWNIGQIIVPLLNYCFFTRAAKQSLHTSPEYWLGLKINPRNEEIIKEVKCYHLGKFYENRATKALKKYLEKLDDMNNGKFEKRHIDSYGMKKEI